MPRPAISIVLPTYNRELFLPQAFQAILDQACRDWELIIVDDGSTDATASMVERWRPRFAQEVTYVHQPNRGAYAARNTGVQHASGEFVAFYDSDDLWLPHHLARCLSAFRRHPDLDWVYGACRRVDHSTGRLLDENSFYVNGRPRGFLKARTRNDGDLCIVDDPHIIEYQLLHGLYCGLQNSVIRRSVFTHLRFNEKLRVVEDEMFLLRALAAGGRIAYYTQPHFIYRVHGDNSSASSNRSSERLLAIFQEYIDGFEALARDVALTSGQQRALRRRLSREHFWHIGYHGLWLGGRREAALAAFRRGLSLYPWDFRFWRAYLLAKVRTTIGHVPSPQT